MCIGDVGSHNAEVIFKKFKFSPGLRFSVLLYNSQLNNIVSKQYVKYRVVSDFFEIIIQPSKKKAIFSYSLEPIKKKSLQDFRNIFELLLLFAESQQSVIFEVKREGLPSFESKILISGEVIDFSWGYQTCEFAIAICNELKVDFTKIMVTLDELINCQNSIEKMYKVLKEDISLIKVEFLINLDESSDEVGKKKTFTFFARTIIGSDIIGVCIGLSGTIEHINNNKYHLITEKRITGPAVQTNIDNGFNNETISDMLESFENSLRSTGSTTVRLL
ncbi:MAG: hypothetical protein GY714_21795 [Desulfobacterales bacterium]|nr:hypothetical protein [Desulfobacterales bacterium]